MANTKISAMTDAGTLTGAEVVPMVQSGANKKATLNTIKTFVNAGGSGTLSSLLGWFDVRSYGATGDGVTNDTAAIQAAINAAFAAGGGTVYFKNGTYIIGGALITSLDSINPNCQLYIPKSSPDELTPTITLLGESAPSFEHSILVEWPINQRGVILKSTITGSGTLPALLGCSYVSTVFGPLNLTDVFVENINFRVKSKTGVTHIANTMCGINFQLLSNACFKRVLIDIESDSFNSIEPTAGTIGLIGPGINNDALIQGDIMMIRGFDFGASINEHADFNNITFAGCKIGLYCGVANHALKFGLLHFNGCATNMQVNGTYVIIELFDTEHIVPAFATKWYNFVADLTAVGATSYVSLTYHVVRSGVGPAFADWATNMTTTLNAKHCGE